jgi:GTPase SAR1 family protein
LFYWENSGVGKTGIVQCFVYDNFNTDNPSTEVAGFIYKIIKFPEHDQPTRFQTQQDKRSMDV